MVWAAFPHKENRMSREDDFDDFTLSPDDLDSGQTDASEPSYDDIEPVPPASAPPEPAGEAQPAAKRTVKKRKPAAKPKAKVKAKAKAPKKAAKPSRKPAARKVAAKKKKKTAPKKRAKAKPKK